MAMSRLYIQHKVNGCQQEMRPVRLCHERIDGFQCILRQLDVLSQHDDGHLGLDLLDLGCDDPAIQETQLVVEDNCINRPRHKQPQTLATRARGQELVSILLQQTQLGWIPVYAE